MSKQNNKSLVTIYGPLINISSFSITNASLLPSKGWRPSFNYYTKWTALFGAVSSVVLMFLFTWWAALITACVIFFLFGYVNYNKPSESETILFFFFFGQFLFFSFLVFVHSWPQRWTGALQSRQGYTTWLCPTLSPWQMWRITSRTSGKQFEHIYIYPYTYWHYQVLISGPYYRPQCLVLTGSPNQRPALVDFVSSFTKNMSLMICGDIVRVSNSDMNLGSRKQVSADFVFCPKMYLFWSSGAGQSDTNTWHYRMAGEVVEQEKGAFVLYSYHHWQSQSRSPTPVAGTKI